MAGVGDVGVERCPTSLGFKAVQASHQRRASLLSNVQTWQAQPDARLVDEVLTDEDDVELVVGIDPLTRSGGATTACDSFGLGEYFGLAPPVYSTAGLWTGETTCNFGLNTDELVEIGSG